MAAIDTWALPVSPIMTSIHCGMFVSIDVARVNLETLKGEHMIKRSLFALLAGVMLATTLFYGSSVNAACGGACANRRGRLVFSGCSVFIEADDRTARVTCSYVDEGVYALNRASTRNDAS